MDEVLEATLLWGDVVIQTAFVPSWDKVAIADLFAVPPELGGRVVDFGPAPFVGERKMVTWGSLVVVVEVAHAAAAPPRSRADGATLVGIAAAAAVHALLLLAGYALPNEATEITADRIPSMRAQVESDEAEPRAVAHSLRPTEEDRAATEGRAPLSASGAGLPGARASARGVGVPSHGGASPADEAATFGMLRLLDGVSVGSSTMTGIATRDTGLAWMDGGEGGGLALSGIGEGGGGPARGVDVDPNLGLGLTGPGLGGSCDETCVGSPGLGGLGRVGRGQRAGHAVRAPTLCDDGSGCDPTVSGRLPPEAIQRVVRANEGRFRLCYADALARNPGLEGRMVVEFVIGRDGNVAFAREGERSRLANPEAVACIVRAFAALSFPEPTGGVVHVTYPLMLRPD